MERHFLCLNKNKGFLGGIILIYYDNRFHLPIGVNNDENQHLIRVTELENFDQFISRVSEKLEELNLKEGNLYYEELNPFKKFGRKKTNRSRFHSEINSAFNRRLTNHHPHLLSERALKLFRNKLNIDISGAEENALWLTSYAYEFFFIQLPLSEMKYQSLRLNKRITSISDAKKSYINLRKLFITIYAPLAFGQGVIDNGINFVIEEKQNIYNRKLVEYINEYVKVIRSEGLFNYIFPELVEMDLISDISSEALKVNYNERPILNTFFVQLFADEAYKLLKKNKYRLNKDKFYLTEREYRQGYRSLMDFYLKDFMPIVLKKLEQLAMDAPSNAGWDIYRSLNGIRDAIKNNQDVLKKIYIEKLGMNMNPDKIDWDSWYRSIENGSEVFNTWRDNTGSGEYDPFNINKTTDDLLNNTFDDKRNKREQDHFRYF